MKIQIIICLNIHLYTSKNFNTSYNNPARFSAYGPHRGLLKPHSGEITAEVTSELGTTRLPADHFHNYPTFTLRNMCSLYEK